MGNCLVTKLKGVVNNPNLPKLGYMVVKFNGVENQRYTIGAYNPGTVEIMGNNDVVFTDNNTKYHDIPMEGANPNNLVYGMQFPQDSIIHFAPTEPNNDVDSLVEVDLNDLQYSPYLRTVWAVSSRAYGDIEIITKSTNRLGNLIVANCPNITGNINNMQTAFSDCQWLKPGETATVMIHLYRTKATGNMGDFLDYIASIASQGNTMYFNMDQSNIVQGTAPATRGYVTFDGNGGYTLQP
jgi:hypothetical protein